MSYLFNQNGQPIVYTQTHNNPNVAVVTTLYPSSNVSNVSNSSEIHSRLQEYRDAGRDIRPLEPYNKPTLSWE